MVTDDKIIALIKQTDGTVKASVNHWARTYGRTQKEMEQLFKEARK